MSRYIWRAKQQQLEQRESLEDQLRNALNEVKYRRMQAVAMKKEYDALYEKYRIYREAVTG